MKKFLLFLGLIFCASHAHAATCPITAGSSSTTIVNTIQGCSSGNTVTFAAGTYTLSSTVNVPCGVSITGPTVSPGPYTTGDGYTHWGYTPTAIINFSSTVAFSHSGCSTAALTEYLEMNGGRSGTAGDGGQCNYFASGASNQTVSYLYCHGNNANSGGSSYNPDTMIMFDGPGATSDPVDSSDTVTWNRLGASGDCSGVMLINTDPSTGSSNGGCAGIASHTAMLNFTIEHNTVYYQEQGQKFYEGPPSAIGVPECLNCIIEYNDWSNIHRIDFEDQVTRYNYVNITVDYNSIHDAYTPNAYSYGLSDANGCTPYTNPSTGNCITHSDYNVVIMNLPTTVYTYCETGGRSCFNGIGIEEWGASGPGGGDPSASGTTTSYNLIQGQWSNDISVAQDGAFLDNGNLMENAYGNAGSDNPDGCTPGLSMLYGWWNLNGPVNTPSGSGNQCIFYNGAVHQSVSPSTTPCTSPPSCGTYSSGQIVTLHNNGTNLDANTTIWYTTDGTTPACASGTSKPIADGGTITLTSTTTIKSIGMWGAPNQPCSYPTGPLSPGGSPAGYGYQPSSVVTSNYTIGGGTTTAPPGVSVIVISEIPEQKIVTHADGPNGQNYRVAVVIPEQPVTVSVPTPCTSGLYMFQVIGNTLQPICWNIAPVGSTSLFVDGAGKWAARPTGVAW